MQQYLSKIKLKVDTLIAAGCTLDTEDVIIYTLNGLPTSYQSFKTTIRTNLPPLSPDDFYPLLCSEETNLENEAARAIHYV
ncbi:hypothetical protein MA16_Dca026925 [Dendrobium catenatum]|uniref:Retrovirus-related Pol polyprotein from transposon TNT 1-94 n=1 Tax=Dendrobium catenatum TaxID=906689 RepID=A0A2I0X4X0_9ASPA|nr:hypothetical protein MA16_Dca026925 [Dendrobium catenatum]